MARGTALNPCLEHAAWLGASHDVTCCRSGGGDSRTAPNSTSCPAEESWWSGMVIIIAVCCASLVFLTVLVIICYKAIKRKPLRKEENGTSVAEYPMTSSQNNKAVDVNSAVV
ncbi:PREDICTED: proline-rich membrane anchor 1 [Hipposideros armiger]|uniref:Proline-rich membrane anchor 1 n=1 Tax=Hipposideros armiger TaxID=186990 RepID=A0A8B7RAI1_HIPAR|nr:PREDICTED: proline-rich membrane anchor 1 [Hipposideros armiger]